MTAVQFRSPAPNFFNDMDGDSGTFCVAADGCFVSPELGRLVRGVKIPATSHERADCYTGGETAPTYPRVYSNSWRRPATDRIYAAISHGLHRLQSVLQPQAFAAGC